MKLRLDWSAYKDAGMGDAYADIPQTGGDFAKAVAVCINSRQCETDGKGVMCPSFRVTANPDLSTGGRVRLLKRALNADSIQALLNDQQLADAMDECIACKGCKRECENNVDMALIKAEYLSQLNAEHGVSLRSRLFAHLPRWLHRHRWLGSLVRLRNHWSRFARLMQGVLGIRADRRLPETKDPLHQAELASALTGQADEALPEVVLLVDTFTRHYQPDIAEAALAVLKAGGYRTLVATTRMGSPEPDRPLCCGRTYLAQGMIDEARYEARRLLDALLPHVRAGRVVVGLEPSCLLGLRDDYLALGLGEAARELAGSAWLFEEFLAREQMAKRLDLPFKVPESETETLSLVHGHCHQKAVGAMKSMRKVLKLIPGQRFRFIDAGCCGMAGTYGLEQEHAVLSDAMAQMALWPALDEEPEARVIANGFSCRQQIAAHDERPAMHLAQVLRDALNGSG